jgi:alanyl-tRNA synthetase
VERLTDDRFLKDGFYQPKSKDEEKEIRSIGKDLTFEKLYRHCAEVEKQNAEQKAEIERLTREVDKQKNFVTAWEESWKIANEQNTKIRVKLKKENAELQKQVDELKKTISIKVGYIDRVESEVVEWQFATKKSVKDTAKEILQRIMTIIKKSDGFLCEEVVRIMAKQNGVEVE